MKSPSILREGLGWVKDDNYFFKLDNSPIRWIILLFVLTFCISTIYAQEIDCDNSVYLSTHISTGTDLYKFQVDAENGIHNLEPIFTNNTDYRIGCLGYSVVDKMLYGLELNTHNLLRINSFGEITNLGVPKGLDTTLSYYSGAVFPSGRDFFMIGQDPARLQDVAFYSVDVFDERATPLALISDGAVTIQDMARNPLDGNVFGYDSNQDKVITVEIGQVNNYQLPSIEEFFSALFFDKSGNLYGYGDKGGSTSRKFFSIHKITGQAEFLTDGPIGNDGDACGCPYIFQFFKKITPEKALPCQEVTIEYTFTNTSGSARTNLTILDELPVELLITSINFKNDSNKFNARINSGAGTNMVDISRVEVQFLDRNKITVKAIVQPDASGLLTSQAVLTNLPLALNPEMISDNIETTDLDDPNFLEIIETDMPLFDDQIEYNCENNSAIITAPFPSANSFLWNDGSTNPTLMVDQPGSYTVEMETDCGNYTHSTTANFDSPAKFIDLGSDRTEDQGGQFSLDYETNMENIATYEWNSTNPIALSCMDCARPTANLLEPATFFVTITNEQGCTAADEIVIDLNTSKKIYAPTVFSPNGDGINDVFFLQGTNAIIEEFSVFDRWGNQVFTRKNGQINDIAIGWEGDFANDKKINGVFIWSAQVVYPDNTKETLSGTVTLLR